jgi:excisionase family DNA binding protein
VATEKEFYSVREFATAIGSSTDRVYEWLRTGRINGIKVTETGNWRIPKSELERLKRGSPNIASKTGVLKESKIAKKPVKEADTLRDARLEEHFHELAQTAKKLARNMQILIRLKREHVTIIYGDIVKGGSFSYPLPEDNLQLPLSDDDLFHHLKKDRFLPKMEKIDAYLAACLFEHFNHQFPKLTHYKDWQEVNFENVKQEIMDKLLLLAHSRAFEICLSCQVCKALHV